MPLIRSPCRKSRCNSLIINLQALSIPSPLTPPSPGISHFLIQKVTRATSTNKIPTVGPVRKVHMSTHGIASILYNNYSKSTSCIWSDKITNKHVARVGYNHFISNKGEWNNCFSNYSQTGFCRRFLFPQCYKASGKKIFKLGTLFSIWRKTPTIG